MSTLDKYFNTVQKALLIFQHIEVVIKIYLACAYWIILKNLENQIPFKFSYDDVKNDSLGKLLKKFEKLNSNEYLIKNSKKLINDRNFIAHQAYLIKYEEKQDNNYLSKEIKEIEKIVISSNEFLNILFKELQKIEKIKNSIK